MAGGKWTQLVKWKLPLFFSSFLGLSSVVANKESEAGTIWLFELCKGFWVWHGGVGCHGMIFFCFSFINYLMVFFCKIIANYFQQWIYIYLKLYTYYTSTVYKTKKYRKIWNFDKIRSKILIEKSIYGVVSCAASVSMYTLSIILLYYWCILIFFLYLQIEISLIFSLWNIETVLQCSRDPIMKNALLYIILSS